MKSWVYKRESCRSHQIKTLSKDIIGMSKGSKMLIANANIFDEFINKIPRGDFIKARAESDSSALKKKFSDDKIHKKNQPNNTSCRSLYSIAEKIRYEALGARMLKGVEKNLKENYLR